MGLIFPVCSFNDFSVGVNDMFFKKLSGGCRISWFALHKEKIRNGSLKITREQG